jgi:hypothetical protein
VHHVSQAPIIIAQPLPKTHVMTILVAKHTGHGHHDEYLRLFEKVLMNFGRPISVAKLGFTFSLSRDPILFLMFEAAPMDFAFTAILRGVLFRRTACLLFRPGECINGTTIRMRLKRLLLKSLFYIPGCSVITILPFSVEPRFAEISKFGIFDPQLWDLEDLDVVKKKTTNGQGIVSIVDSKADGRKVILALGNQTAEKGFDYFCQLWSSRSGSAVRQKFLFVAAGKVADSSMHFAEDFQRRGGVLINRVLANDEMVALYGRADMIWSCYSPGYNQASGIFGRAVQYGVPVVLRSGSYVDSLSKLIGHPVIDLNWEKTEETEALLENITVCQSKYNSQRKIAQMRASSLAAIAVALGINQAAKRS